MNRIFNITSVLFGASMLAGTAYASGISKTDFCKQFEYKVDRLCEIHAVSCDRRTRRFNAICGGVETIYASPSADGEALDLLRQDYNVVTVDKGFPVRFLAEHVVVTAADLDDPTFTSLLNLARNAGKTVAIVEAAQDETNRFARFFGWGNGASCSPTTGSSRIELYGLQESRMRHPPLSSSYCLVGLDALDKRGKRSVRRWLGARFALTAPEPTTPGPTSEVSDSSGNIVDLATAVHCSLKDGNDPANQGRILTQDMYVTGARSFTNSQDIYYVQNDLEYTQGSSTKPTYAYQVIRFGATGVTDFAGGLSQSQPATTTAFESSFTNTTTETISASVGFNAMGPTGTVGASVTHGQSVGFSIPATTVLNQSVNPFPGWNFERQNTAGQDYNPQTSWFWTVPWEDYADGGEGSTGRLEVTSQISMGGNFVGETSCAIPYPFEGILDVGAPTITSLSATEVERGQSFKIFGKELYPGLVTAVLLEGLSVGDSNFTANGETTPGSGVFSVTVVVPANQPTGKNTVLVQQEFNLVKQFTPGNTSITVSR